MNNLLEKLNVIYNILEKHIKKNSLVITHNAGFFSCCSVRLDKIVNYFNEKKYLPNIVDSSKTFELYKTNTNVDITNEYFEDYNNITILKPKLNNHYMNLKMFL